MSKIALLLFTCCAMFFMLTIAGMAICAFVWPYTNAFLWPVGIFGSVSLLSGLAMVVSFVIHDIMEL